MSHVTVQATLYGRVIRDVRRRRNYYCPILWRWDPTDPYVLTMHLPQDVDDPWVIPRVNLAHGGYGLNAHVTRSHERLLLELTGDCDSCVIEFPLDEIDALLAGAENRVPLDGSPPGDLVDAAIARLLGAMS